MKIFKRCGHHAAAVLRRNPYRLANDIALIGFKTADRMVRQMDLPADSPLRAEAGVLYLLREFADQGHVFAPLCIIAPQAATLLSVDEGLIRAAIDRLNGQKRNNYDKDIFNGDVGRIAALNENGRGLDVRFDGRIVSYDAAEPDEIMTAYAISVHKAQGSEFPAVVIPVLTQHDVLLQRNLIYTAITRGRRLAVLVGSRRALAMAVARNDQGIRHSGLHQRLTA